MSVEDNNFEELLEQFKNGKTVDEVLGHMTLTELADAGFDVWLRPMKKEAE